LTEPAHALGAGLTDPDLLDHHPSNEEPVVIRANERASSDE